VAGSTPTPDAWFMAQAARRLTDAVDGFLAGHRILICDRDSKWSCSTPARRDACSNSQAVCRIAPRPRCEGPSAQHLALHREPAPLVIRQPQPAPFQLLAQQAVLLQQVLDDRKLALGDPAGEELKEQREPYRQRVHG
jgi:hypothetical protein